MLLFTVLTSKIEENLTLLSKLERTNATEEMIRNLRTQSQLTSSTPISVGSNIAVEGTKSINIEVQGVRNHTRIGQKCTEKVLL